MLIKNSIVCGEALTELQKLEDHSIDFVLIDPPFGMTASKWDIIIEFDKLWKELHRVITKEGVIVSFAAQPFTTLLIHSNLKKYKYSWYWIKNQGTNFFHAKRMPIRKVEEICVFGGKNYFPIITDGHSPTNSAYGSYPGKVYHGKNKRDYKGGITTRYPTNILEFKCVDNYSRIHPNQKPLDLCEYLIKTYTQENEVVLDCFAGSGTTLIAAQKLNRQWIGIDSDELAIETIKQRFASLYPEVLFDGL